MTLPRVPVSVARARAGLRPLRSALGERYEDAVLLVSELVTNAIRHGQGPTVKVSGRVRGEGVHIEVVDHGHGFVPPTRRPHPDEPGGRGLPIVSALADDWGVFEGDSTHVWFVIDLG